MKARCYNPVNKSYHRYGGRGIKICDEWVNDFVAFRDWAHSHGYAQDFCIDRIDVDKGYEPSNCRFVTGEENSRNMVNGRMRQITDLKSRIEAMEAELKRRGVL